MGGHWAEMHANGAISDEEYLAGPPTDNVMSDERWEEIQTLHPTLLGAPAIRELIAEVKRLRTEAETWQRNAQAWQTAQMDTVAEWEAESNSLRAELDRLTEGTK